MRKLLLISPFALLLFCLFFASCEKPDQPVSLPPKSGSAHATVNMGEDYTDQLFYDLYSGEVVYKSLVNSWDLAFEASPSGYHVFVNGGKNIFVYNTHKTDMADVSQPPSLLAKWDMDQSSGAPDSTAIGEWKGLNEVYILKFDTSHIKDGFRKIQILSVSDESYTISYSDLSHPYGKTVTIPKDANYNYAFFSLQEERIAYPEPPKNTWDIVFTRYRTMIYDGYNMPYIVSGALLNPNNTAAALDSLTPYQNMNAEVISRLQFSSYRDVIGYTWKSYNFSAGAYGHYTVHPEKVYVIRNRNNQFYKLHFLDFYNSQGVKGNPSFEYEQLK